MGCASAALSWWVVERQEIQTCRNSFAPPSTLYNFGFMAKMQYILVPGGGWTERWQRHTDHGEGGRHEDEVLRKVLRHGPNGGEGDPEDVGDDAGAGGADDARHDDARPHGRDGMRQ